MMNLARRILMGGLAAGALFVFAGCGTAAETPSASDASATAAATEASAKADASEASEAAATEASAAESTAADQAQETALTDTAGGDMTSDLPSPNPAYQTLRVTGTISSIEDEQDIVYITDDGAAAEVAGSSEIGAVEADDCILMDAQTGAEVSDDSLRPGDRVEAYVGLTMTRSIPPQAPCYAMFTDLPESGTPTAHYVRALTVTPNADGGVDVLNQNADVLVTIPADLAIEVFDEAQTATLANITSGTRMIVWYGAETRSIPAQATATRVMLDIDD